MYQKYDSLLEGTTLQLRKAIEALFFELKNTFFIWVNYLASFCELKKEFITE